MAVDRCALWRPDHMASHSPTLSPVDGLIFPAVNSRSFARERFAKPSRANLRAPAAGLEIPSGETCTRLME
jgi:hypothetical protein